MVRTIVAGRAAAALLRFRADTPAEDLLPVLFQLPAHILPQHLEMPAVRHRRLVLLDQAVLDRHRDHIGSLADLTVQMADDLQIAVDQPVHPKLPQDLPVDILRRLPVLPVDQRVLYIIVENARGHHFFPRMAALRQFHYRVHIDHQLQLQPVVHRGQIELRRAGFIIDDLHIDPLPVLAQIEPVNASPQMQCFLVGELDLHGLQIVNGGKGHLVSRRFKIAFAQLLRQRPDGALRHPLDPRGHVLIARRTFEDRIAIFLRHAGDTFPHQSLPLLVAQFSRL